MIFNTNISPSTRPYSLLIVIMLTVLTACGGTPTAPPQTNASSPAPTNAPASATAAPAAAAATTGSATTSVPQPTQDTATASEPKRGGIYRLLGEYDIASLDAQVACNFEDWWAVGYLLYNRLYSWDKDGNLTADLAADMPQVSADGLEYTLTLRKGVLFHNGRELTADDVKYSLERVNTLKAGCWGGEFMNIVGMADVVGDTPKATEASGIEIIDAHTLKIKLLQPAATFAASLATSGAGIGPKQEIIAAGNDWGSKVVIGTGPFKLTNWSPGEKATFERNDTYYKPGLPYLDGVELYEKVTPATQMLRWESGEAEFINSIPPQELGRIFSTPDLEAQLRTFDSMQYKRVMFDVTPGRVTADPRVRQAIAMAIDKVALSKFQRGSEPMDTLYTPAISQYNPDFKNKWLYDPEAAKLLLQEAGVEPGTKIGIFSGPGKEFGELVQADLKAIGFDATLYFDKLPEDKYVAGEIPVLIYGSSPSFPDAFSAARGFACGDSPNADKACDTRIDDLIAKSEVLSPDDSQRTANYREAEEIIINDATTTIPLIRLRVFGLGSPNIKDDFVHPVHTLPMLEYAYFVQP